MKHLVPQNRHFLRRRSAALAALFAGVVTFAVCATLLAATTAAGPSGEQRQPVSVLEVPFRFSLKALYQETERIVPVQTGHWRDWKRHHGIDTQYRAWRGPLVFRLSGDTLTVQAHVRYWVKARADLLGAVEVSGSCGVSEAPRQALIGLQARLAWNPDWTLRPQVRLLPPRFLDRCEMTVADIDVTPLVGQAFQQEMRRSLRQAMGVLAPHLSGTRAWAERLWADMNRPVPVADGSWLVLKPVGVAASPLFGSGNEATAHLAVALRPSLSLGAEPAHRPTPLPPLQAFTPSSPDLRFQLALTLDYPRLGRMLTDNLAGETFRVKDHSFDIRSVDLSGAQQELHIELRLGGQAAGKAEIWATVAFDPASQAFRLDGFDYLFKPDDPDVYVLADLFYDKIRAQLMQSANRLIAQQMVQTRTQLQQALLGIAPEGIELDLGQMRLERVRVRFEPEGVGIEGTASGPIRLRG
jgi:hypothetical protein